MTTIVQCGIAKFIGLPDTPDLDNFETMWRKRIAHVDYNPITLLCCLFSSPDDAIRLHERLKLSSYERDLAFFVAKFKDETKDCNELM